MSKCDFKIVLLGNEYVGKTSLVLRFMRCSFNTTTPYQSTVGAAFCSKRMTSRDQEVTVGIWDTAGSERYESMSRLYYRDAQAAVICYDPTCRHSWERLRHWLQQVRAVEEDCKLYLCGTKKDLMDTGEAARAIPEETVALYSQDLCGHVLTSSKTGENVEELFQMVVDDLVGDKKFMKVMEENRQLMERDMLKYKPKSKDHCVCSLQ